MTQVSPSRIASRSCSSRAATDCTVAPRRAVPRAHACAGGWAAAQTAAAGLPGRLTARRPACACAVAARGCTTATAFSGGRRAAGSTHTCSTLRSSHSSSMDQRAQLLLRRRPQYAAVARAAAAPSSSSSSHSSCGDSGGGGGGSSPLPRSSPVCPQRSATQSGSAGVAPPASVAAAAASAAAALPLQAQQQAQAQHAVQPDGVSQARVWLPDKQLWVPRPSAAVASPVNPLGGSSTSGPQGPSLARVFMASAAAQGRKSSMEDRHVVAALHPQQGVVAPGRRAVAASAAVSVAGVFDGHAGDATAALAAAHIPRLLHAALSGSAASSTDLAGPNLYGPELLPPARALTATFRRFDRWWADARCDPQLTEHGWDESGSTAVVGMVSGQHLVVANAGDSIALLAHSGSSRRLTEDHRLFNAAEAARVKEAGGRVVVARPGAAPRVMGTSSNTRFRGSMVTRSLGDFAFKHPQPLLSPDPYVSTHALSPSDRLVLLTSDGVSDVLPDDDMLGLGLDAIAQAQHSTNNGTALAKAAATAVMNAAYASGSKDNLTVVAMLLDWGGEYEDSA